MLPTETQCDCAETVVFLLCSGRAVALGSGWLKGSNGRGKRNTLSRNWAIKGRTTGICVQFSDMLKRLLVQCHLVLCFCTCMGGIILRIQKKESANGTSVSLCIVLTAAEKAITGMETHLGSCPVSAVYVQSVSSLGHSAALLSDMLSNTSSEMLPTK